MRRCGEGAVHAEEADDGNRRSAVGLRRARRSDGRGRPSEQQVSNAFPPDAYLLPGLSFRRSESGRPTVILSVVSAFLAGCGGIIRIFSDEKSFGITFARFAAREGSIRSGQKEII